MNEFSGVTRREVLKLGGIALAGGAMSLGAGCTKSHVGVLAEASKIPARESQPALQSVFVAAHEVPPPKSISPQAQAFLSARATPPPPTTYPSLDDKAGWKAFVDAGNAVVEKLYRLATTGKDGREEQLQTETISLGGVRTYVATPLTSAGTQGIFLDIHGGAFCIGGGELCRLGGMRRARSVGARTYAVDYRMPPDHPYPAALDDCLTAYRALLDRHAPGHIVVGGGSAGGNLAAALMLRARDERLPLPAGVVLLTSAVDLTESGDSYQTNFEVDVNLGRRHPELIALYAAGHDLTHPYLSPLFGDFTKGFPPAFLQSGTRDLLLSDAVRMHRALRKAGVEVELHIFEGMPHGGFFGAPEDQELEAEVRRFLEACWWR